MDSNRLVKQRRFPIFHRPFPSTIPIASAVPEKSGAGQFFIYWAFGGWIFSPARAGEGLAMGAAGALLLFADVALDVAGLGACVLVLVLHWWQRPQFESQVQRG